MFPEKSINSNSINETSLLAICQRYPEKTFFLGQVFNDTTNSYKLVWFLGLLSLIRNHSSSSFEMTDIFIESAIIAWSPVCLYKLSLGRQDQLQNVVISIQKASGLPPNEQPDKIRNFIRSSDIAKDNLSFLRRFVPTRFLTPWFADHLRGIRDHRKRNIIKEKAFACQATSSACPYWLEGKAHNQLIRLNETWKAFLIENMGLIQAFTEYHFSIYLQARNPNVPGILNKLHTPTHRNLTAARLFWDLVRNDLTASGKIDHFKDIFTGNQLNGHFEVDHFLPWSFVAHDLFWNLAPVEKTINGIKSDLLPDIPLYLPKLAKLHHCAIEAEKNKPKILEDYVDCFKVDIRTLLAIGEEGFIQKYKEVIEPQAQIAKNMGFQSGWRYSP